MNYSALTFWLLMFTFFGAVSVFTGLAVLLAIFIIGSLAFFICIYLPYKFVTAFLPDPRLRPARHIDPAILADMEIHLLEKGTSIDY